MKKYRLYRSTSNRLKMHEKRLFYQELFRKIGGNLRTLWSVLNSLIEKSNNKVDTIELISRNQKVTAPDEISNLLNNHFATAGKKVQARVKCSSTEDPVKYVKRVNTNLLFGHVSESEICWLVMKLKSKFSTGLDGISNDFLKKIVYSIKLLLC